MKFSCRLALALALALGCAASAGEPKLESLRDGDIVFSSSVVGQGGAIMAATGSPYTHCGLVLLKDGKPMVLEARQPVGVVSLEVFRARSTAGTFMVRRPKTPPSPADFQSARTWAEAQIGKNYDAHFRWDDDQFYCSELVWKIYQHAGVELCEPRRFRDYKLDDPKVQKIVEERYGSIEKLPPDEKVVAPADLAGSAMLAEVPQDGS